MTAQLASFRPSPQHCSSAPVLDYSSAYEYKYGGSNRRSALSHSGSQICPARRTLKPLQQPWPIDLRRLSGTMIATGSSSLYLNKQSETAKWPIMGSNRLYGSEQRMHWKGLSSSPAVLGKVQRHVQIASLRCVVHYIHCCLNSTDRLTAEERLQRCQISSHRWSLRIWVERRDSHSHRTG